MLARMKSNFDTCLPLILAYEGGYVNHPADPGGATNKGVTQATYNAWRKAQGLAARSVKASTAAEVSTIYRNSYWNAVKADELPAGVDLATFDPAVNSGPSRGAKWLQGAVGATVDGAIGPKTLLAVAKADAVATVKKICALRTSFLHALRTWSIFGKGWAARVASVEVNGIRMATAAKVAASPPPGIDAAVQAAAETKVIAAAEAASSSAAASSQAKKATGAGAGGAGSAAATQAQPDQVVNLILLGLIGVAIVVVIVLLWRAHVNRARAAAYAAVAKG
mgnify:CR=1 FL=1